MPNLGMALPQILRLPLFRARRTLPVWEAVPTVIHQAPSTYG